MSLQDLLILNERYEELGKENEQLKQQLKEAVRVIEYLYPKVDGMFIDIPEGLSPMFYHTLYYDGDMKVRERLDNIANFLAKYRGEK